MATRLRSWPDIVARVWQSLFSAFFRDMTTSTQSDVKQESDVRAQAAQLPGDFITADDVLELRRMGGT